MKLRYKLLSLLAAVALMPACGEKNEPIADIIVSVEPSTVELTSAAADQNVSITATRAWKATVVYEGDDANWLSVSPESGAASTEKQPMTITVKENTGRDRQAKVKITIGLDDAFLTVKQDGPGGSADPVFFNDFDKKKVEKGDNWPYVSDCADSWQNETGTGISTLSYVTDNNKATIRSNANSPTPAASGVNNWFFGANAYFCVKDITLPSVSNFTVSFFGNRAVYGKEKGSGESVFDHNIFKVYISADNHKWVSLDYAFEGGDPDADWGQASSTFTLPSGTAKLSIYIPALTETSTYRLDDIKLDVASQAGTAIDFSQGIEMEIGGGGDKPGTPTGTGVESDPYNPTAAINKAKEIGKTASTEYYYIKGFVSSIKEIATGDFGNATFYITDTKAYDTTPFYCYRCKYIGGAKFTSKDQLKVGDEVVVKAKLLNYEGNTPETSDASLVSINGGGGGEEIETEKVADVIAAAEGSKVTLKNALVVASAKDGYLVTDAEGKDFIYVFDKGAASVPAVGDKGNVKATKSSYSSMPQLKSPQFTTVSSGTEVTYPDPEDITSGFDSFTSTKVKYISYTGKLSISGAYYNIEVPGATKNGALVAPAIDMTPYVGVEGLTYEGYYLYTTSGKYVYIIFTKVGGTIKPFFRLSAESANVSAAATSAKFSVSASDAIDWSIAAPAGVTATPASGTGSKEITVTFPANETESEVNYALKVSTTSADIEIKELTFNIKQAGKSAPGEGLVLSKETINTSGWTVNSYGSQATATASTYLNWTTNGVSFTGCKLCLPTAGNDYDKVNAIQCQGNASDATKQARFGNTTSLGVIKRITVVSYNSATNTPNFNLALGTAQVVGTSIPTGMTNAASMVTDKEAAGNVTKFTTVYDVEGAYDYFAIYNNTVGALYWSEVIIETGDGPVKPTFRLSATSANVGAAATSTTFGVVASGDVSWTVSAPAGVTATPASGTGNQTVTLSFPANETESEVNYSVKVSTTNADVDTKDLTFALKQAAKVPVGTGLVLSKETINTSGWTVNSYGSQATATASTYLNWTTNGVSFTGCKLCLPTAGNNYDKVNAIQCQGNASDATKQARFGNTSAMGKIRKITVVSYYTADYSPNFNLALGTSQIVGTAVPEGMIGAASMTTTSEEVGNIVKYTTTYEVTGDNTFFAIYKNTAGAFYWSEITVETE